uniref:Xylulose kinase-1 n=1 Tax=Tanacetum cinerariifolium TaxID=118510 RepID=A0A699GZE5_TANCI|nr:hypothetical protein [Tanacetum cinerariifolium]
MAPIIFADTHNMIVFLTKSDASEGFDQIMDFLIAHPIHYALMVNPIIYVLYIKQFWASVSIKKSNDVVMLQALIDKKKVMDIIRQDLRLDDVDGIDCLPNEEIFAEFARMGYKKSSTKLTFYKTCATLTKKVANLEQDKIAQALEIIKVKQKVKRLEKKRRTKHSGLKRGKIIELDADEDVTLEDVDAEVAMDAKSQGRMAESQAKAYHLDLQHAKKVLSMHDTDEAEPTEVKEVIEMVTATKKRRGVVIPDPEETAAASVIVHSEVKSKDKGKRILIEEPKPLKRQAQIKEEQVKRREKQDNTVMRYQYLKRKPFTEAQARKNMMIYLKHMAGFKMDFFTGMTYNEIRHIFEKHYNSIKDFLEKEEEEVIEQEEGSKRKGDSLEQKAAKKQRIDKETEELKTHLQIIVNDDDDVYTEATPLASKFHVVDYQIHHEKNKPYYKIIRADGTHKLFLSFNTLLKSFDREDLEALWKLVKERFESAEPKNFLEDFLLNTFKIMFKKPNVEANVWRDQKGRYGLAKVKI